MGGGELGWAQRFGDFVVGWVFVGWVLALAWQRRRAEVWRDAVAVGEALGGMGEIWWEGARRMFASLELQLQGLDQ